MSAPAPVLTYEERAQLRAGLCQPSFACHPAMVEVVESILAAHVAAAHRAGGVEALREAAAWLGADVGADHLAEQRMAGWLTARADQMENGHE